MTDLPPLVLLSQVALHALQVERRHVLPWPAGDARPVLDNRGPQRLWKSALWLPQLALQVLHHAAPAQDASSS